MSVKVRNTKTSRSRFRQWLLIGLLFVLSLSLATMVIGVVVVRLLLPVAAAGIQGLAEFAAASATATLDGLNHGDSQQRLTILTQLNDALGPSNPTLNDPQFTSWITPALKQCQTDSDPRVIALADQILQMLESSSEPVAE